MNDSISPVKCWHVAITGFLQTHGQPTGMVRLWRMLAQEHSGPDCRVELRSWDDNWRYLAELVWRLRPEQTPVELRIYAYSWGAGWGAMQLARQLRRRGIKVQYMVLSDPVYRSRWRALAWLSLMPFSRIMVPDNVARVHWFRQNQNTPAGHRLVAIDRQATSIRPAAWAQIDHQHMDDLHTFHHEAMRVSREP